MELRIKGFQLTDRMAQAIEEAREVKRQEHRVRMVAFRKKKKETQEKLREEHQQLEQQMKRCLEAVRNDIGVPVGNCYLSKMQSLQELVVEREAIQCHNAALRDAIDQHGQYQRLLLESNGQPIPDDRDESAALLGDGEGWRVHFPTGAPSFYFYPFSSHERDEIVNALDPGYASKPISNLSVGTLFGWEVYRTLVVSESLQARSLHAWFTKRLNVSLDEAFKISIEKERELCPILATPMDWNFGQHFDIDVQPLQEVDANTCMVVHNIAGPSHLRYLCCVRRAQWELLSGRCRLELCMVVVDSKANKLIREAEGPHDDIAWLTEGGASITLTEIDDTTIDVSYEHQVACQNELHAGYLMVQWSQFVVQVEQPLVPSSLLSC
ncbi:hypothetical protein PHYBOEH_010449 [Phytophthora boehmeriae]|uniref:Uncharacterized protein n=1 Tax=Phytophthora boehmeriae TaxID=109152 RepID=A0A8T1WY40_9STRA|nr:hypothetical protein PHYBOEH_010449 [Phytophthora boehmeriae]